MEQPRAGVSPRAFGGRFRNASQNEIAGWRAAFELLLEKAYVEMSSPAGSQVTASDLPHWLAAGDVSHDEVRARRPRSLCGVSVHAQKWQTMFDWQVLERPDLDDLDDWFLEQYPGTHELFFEE
jgi:hypothetical protein